MRPIITALAAVLLATFTLSCNTAANRHRRERGGFTDQEYDTLKALNQLLQDHEDAMTLGPGAAGVMISEKAKELAKNLRDSGCKLEPPRGQRKSFREDWDMTVNFNGPASCPVIGRRYWRNFAGRQFYMDHSFTTNNEEFRKIGGVDHFKGDGTIYVNHPNSNDTYIHGDVTYDQIAILGGAIFKATISTNQHFYGVKGRPSVMITIAQKGGGPTYIGEVRWDATNPSDRKYLAGGDEIEEKNFNEIFSFWELDKIVDDTDSMR